MLSFNVCHFHFKVHFQVTAVNPEWQCSVLCKVGTGSETAKGISKTVCDASWHIWNFLLHLLRKPSWISFSFPKNFWILSHVPHHSNWSKTKELLSKFCAFFNSSVLGWVFFVLVFLLLMFCGGFLFWVFFLWFSCFFSFKRSTSKCKDRWTFLLEQFTPLQNSVKNNVCWGFSSFSETGKWL